MINPVSLGDAQLTNLLMTELSSHLRVGSFYKTAIYKTD